MFNIIRLIFVSLIFFVIQNEVHAQISQPMQASQVAEEVQSKLSDRAVSPNSSLCMDISDQIAKVSAMQSSQQVYPWEDLAWLKKNLGETMGIQSQFITVYGWTCQKSTNPPSMVSVMYIVFSIMGVSHTKYGTIICKPGEPCVGYEFERKGEKITGKEVKSPSFSN